MLQWPAVDAVARRGQQLRDLLQCAFLDHDLEPCVAALLQKSALGGECLRVKLVGISPDERIESLDHDRRIASAGKQPPAAAIIIPLALEYFAAQFAAHQRDQRPQPLQTL